MLVQRLDSGDLQVNRSATWGISAKLGLRTSYFGHYFFMHTPAIFSVFLCLFANPVVAQNFDFKEVIGEMRCKVTGHRVTAAVEGQPKYYSGIVNEYEEGYSLIFEYTISKYNGKTNGYASLEDLADDIAFNLYVEDVIKSRYGSGIIGSTVTSKFSLGSEKMLFENGFSQLSLFRYYKSDWSGLLIGSTAVFSENDADAHVTVSTLDCRTVRDGLEDALKLFP